MTKEACAALASIVTCEKFHPSLSLIEKAGGLLISTLTTLKHQGAAFAAHKALQKIADFCFERSSDQSFAHFPSLWAQRLTIEISGLDKVRDSTLRRSTGYALAFLSIMRSEPPTSMAPKALSPLILAQIMRMSMPSESELAAYVNRYDFDRNSFHYTSIHASAELVQADNSTNVEYEVSNEGSMLEIISYWFDLRRCCCKRHCDGVAEVPSARSQHSETLHT